MAAEIDSGFILEDTQRLGLLNWDMTGLLLLDQPAEAPNVINKTVIVTGGANGIGLAVIRQYHASGANVVIADLPGASSAATAAIESLEDLSRVLFVPVNITSWSDMCGLFRETMSKFRSVDIAVANVGIMESRRFFDFRVDEDGQLRDDGAGLVIDVNLKGAMNTLKLAVFHMGYNEPDADGWRGSVVLVSSTSGYTGGTEVVSYVSSKHGVVGLLRSAHPEAGRRGIRVNGVAPFITPTHTTKGYSDAWKAEGLPTNSTSGVAAAIVRVSLDTEIKGQCFMVVGDSYKDVETPRKSHLSQCLGNDITNAFSRAASFFDRIGGYPLPVPRS